MKKPKLEKLIQEIAMFDIDAAYKLHKRKDNKDYRNSEYLDEVMAWEGTKEGDEYWINLDEKLQARRENYHPHHDLMIEYANDKTTGIETFMSERWVECKEPSFYKDVKYRKKPKVTKKTINYRIYLNNKNEIHSVDELNPLPSHLKQWLGDWQKAEIEVEQND